MLDLNLTNSAYDELKTLPVRSFTPQGLLTEKVMLLRLVLTRVVIELVTPHDELILEVHQTN